MNRYSLVSQTVAERSHPTSTEALSLDATLITLVTGDFQSRWDAVKLLPTFEADAIPPLLDLLQTELYEADGDWELVWFITRALGHFNHPVVIRTLNDLLQSTDDTEVAAIAASTLANFGTAAIPALTELLSRNSTRLIAVQALAQVRHPDVISPLLQMVHDSTPEVRSAAIEALSHFYDDAITAALRAGLQDPMRSVRRAAVVALGIQAERLDADLLVADLTPLLWDLHLEVCRQAVMALGRVGTEAAVAALSGVLLSTHTPVELQVEVVRALAWIGSGFALQSIQSCLTSASSRSASEQEQLQREVIAVLGRVESLAGRTIAVKLLLDLLHTAHPISQTSPGKQQIALSLGQLQDANAVDALIHLATDADLIVRLHAVAALKQLPGAYEKLQQRLVELGQVETICGEASGNLTLRQEIETILREWQA